MSVGTFWYARSYAVSPHIDARFVQNEAPVCGEHIVHFKMVLTCPSPSTALRMPGCIRFLPKLHLHSCKAAAQTQLIIIRLAL